MRKLLKIVQDSLRNKNQLELPLHHTAEFRDLFLRWNMWNNIILNGLHQLSMCGGADGM